jgi:tetratricopeptide (TPR) repeat protein
LEDAAQISLDTLSPGEAATLLARLAARPGLRAGDVAVGELTRLCGYLPLAIAMLASQLRNHPVRTGADLAAELAQARDRLALMHVENLSVGAAFGLSYADLTADPRRLFRRLGLVPGPGIDVYSAAALDGIDLATARRHLDELYDQHLIAEPAPGRYQLHDLLREHARALAATDDPAETAEAAGRLLDFYLHTALAASSHFTTRARVYRRPLPGSGLGQAPDVSTLGQAAAWLEAERANLHAAAEYAAGRACFPHATAIPVVMSGFLAARGHWDQSAALHQGALAAARRADDRLGEADVLVQLGALQRETGDYPAAAASLDQAMAIYGDLDDQPGHAHALIDLGFLEVLTGDYPAAAATHQQALALARRASDPLTETAALNHLGLVQHLTGDYPAAAASHQQALMLFGDLGNRLGQAEALNRLGELATRTSAARHARERHTQALAIARDLGAAPEEARALEGLGQSHLQDGDPGQAAAHLRQALTIYQRIGALAARRIQKTLHDHALTSALPAAPSGSQTDDGLGTRPVRNAR